MKCCMKKNVFIVFLTIVCCLKINYLSAQRVVPVPLCEEQKEGAFYVSGRTKWCTDFKGKEKEELVGSLGTLPLFSGKKLRARDAAGKGMIFLHKDTMSRLGEEGYVLEVTPDFIRLSSSSGAGVFYGLQTLLQLAEPVETGGWRVAAVQIEDHPRFAYRGFMMDVSRHFRSKEFVKRQIDMLARYKLNRLHLHLTDAAGWRLEIKKYPRLTEFAAWRPEADWKDWWNGEEGVAIVRSRMPVHKEVIIRRRISGN